jgi:hypothetical protein
LVLAECAEELDAVYVEWTGSWRKLVATFASRTLSTAVIGALVNAPNGGDRVARALICLTWTGLMSLTQVENSDER